MKKLKQYWRQQRHLLYLLQLEEYRGKRFLAWLAGNDINRLQEENSRLKVTPRIIATLLLSLPWQIFFSPSRAIFFANYFLTRVFALIEFLLVFLAGTKLKFYPNLIKIVVTGSYGKTTFKEALFEVLAKKHVVLKTPGNVNTSLAIAWLILTKLNHHQVLIVEAGAYGPGEIKKIARMIRPNFGVITVFGLMHLERFGSQEKIRQAKMELAEFVSRPGRFFRPRENDEMINFETTIIAIAEQLGIDRRQARKYYRQVGPPDRRMKTTKVSPLLTVIDDSYNANPIGFQRSLAKLAQFKDKQKIVITMGLVELGDQQGPINKQIAQKSADIADVFIIARRVNRLALEAGLKESTKKIIIDYLPQGIGWQEAIKKYLNKPTVVLLANGLPDHYF
jgi:UDP-N-acetylmuramoyl-tripeptide--D-alanyl-D-alanine ligase